MPSKAVLITGCSSGIGRATARLLARREWKVYATARRPETIDDLADAGCQILALDVTDEASMSAAVDRVVQAEGAVGVLVNNAGYSQSGAVESVPIDDVRRQFETNVFGAVRMCQLVLPGMREQRWGKIVNLSSMGGRLTFPGGGIYHASKYALEALSDALRFEVRGFGVDVIVIEPGLIGTNFGQTAAASVRQAGGGASAAQAGGVYSDFNHKVASVTESAYRGPVARLGGPPEQVAETIADALAAPRPKTRYPVTASARLMITQRRLTPDRAWDAMMRAQFPTPRP